MLKELPGDIKKQLDNFLTMRFNIHLNMFTKHYVLLLANNREILFVEPRVYSKVKHYLRSRYRKKLKYIGFPFAHIINKKIELDIEGVCLIHSMNYENELIVNNEGEMLFLYGKDLFKKSIIGYAKHYRLGEYVIVVNRLRECLGLGEVMMNYEEYKKAKDNDVIIRNLVDRGIYLRAKP
ncbi:MAG: hypothetical protein DRO67_02180 [Candidatus Asgardarchaeum californiense]|nr:MAG: hypothetical protein DRO67_02180 [Candidatus Asgardarchaeum californiense]